MIKFLAYGCGSLLAVATGVYLLYQTTSRIKFQSVKILDKASLIFLLKQIRADYSQRFLVVLRLNRKKRRASHRGGREYRNLIKELKDLAKEYIQKSIEDVLSKNGLTEDVLAESYKHYEDDEDVKTALTKLCSVESNKKSSLISMRLEQVLELYISKVEEFNENDPNELNIQMKILEDDIFDEFGCEPEEIEAAVNKNPKRVEHLTKIVNDLNHRLLEKTSQDLFF
jgi:hydroxymethylpyrimidine pyrophosphatase-like HAD family hydrolase